MKAAVTQNIQKVSVQEVDIPLLGDNEVLIRVLTAGICGGDVRIYKGVFPYLNFPIINGHECCGIVEDCGKSVSPSLIGSYVTVDPTISCGHCYPCRMGKPNCCVDLKVLGIHVNGCFAEYVAAKRSHIYLLPENVSYEVGSMIEPYCIGMHSLNQLRFRPEDTLLILGAGPIGLAALDIAKGMGAKVMVSELSKKRLNMAEKLCADKVIAADREDIEQAVLDFTGGEGFTTVLEATGVPSVMGSAQKYVASGGRICLAGVTDKEVTFSTMLFCNKEATVVGTRNSNVEFPQVINLFGEKKVHPELIATDRFNLEDYSKAIDLAVNNTENIGKVLIGIGYRYE